MSVMEPMTWTTGGVTVTVTPLYLSEDSVLEELWDDPEDSVFDGEVE